MGHTAGVPKAQMTKSRSPKGLQLEDGHGGPLTSTILIFPLGFHYSRLTGSDWGLLESQTLGPQSPTFYILLFSHFCNNVRSSSYFPISQFHFSGLTRSDWGLVGSRAPRPRRGTAVQQTLTGITINPIVTKCSCLCLCVFVALPSTL